MDQNFNITPKYDILLRGDTDVPIGIYHLHITTAEALCRLHYKPGCIKTIQARLKELTDQGFLQPDSVPTNRFRSPYYYALTHKGMRYLEEAGMDIHEAHRASRENDKHSLFIEHTLELNDVLISAALLKRVAPAYRLDRFVHERVLKRTPYKAVWRDTAGKSQTATLIPDAFLDFRLILDDGRTRRMPVLLEHDRGTEEQQYFRRRIRAYIVLLKSEAYTDLFGVKAITVAFTTFVGEQRLRQMYEWTRQELAATNEPHALGRAFWFTYTPQPPDPRQLWLERCWYTPYDTQPRALLAGEEAPR